LKLFSPTKRCPNYLVMILTIVTLSACSSTNEPEDGWPILFSELDSNSAYFLKKVEETEGQKRLSYQFLSTQALIEEKKPILANSIIKYLRTQPLSLSQSSLLTLLVADNLIAQRKPDEALLTLNKINSYELPDRARQYLLKQQIELLKQKVQGQVAKEQYFAASESLFTLINLLENGDEKQHFEDMLLTQLAQLPSDFLAQYTGSQTQPIPTNANNNKQILVGSTDQQNTVSKNRLKKGWYELASLYKKYQLHPNRLIRALNQWKLSNPNHPTLDDMPTQLSNIPEFSPYQPSNIAVVIPLTGRFKNQAQAIQYGLLNAYYKQRHINNAPEVKFHFYDTQTQTMAEIVNQFTADNIDFIIGPLLKDKVEKLLPLIHNIPVLALNSFPHDETTDNSQAQHPLQYSFPIFPEDEAKQGARYIFSQEHKKPLILVPSTNYGSRVSNAFEQEWAVLNHGEGSPAETYSYKNQSQLATLIASALQTDHSQRRIDQMDKITGLHLNTELRSRRDIDAIYIVSKRNVLVMLKAFIDVSISPFAKKIPMYASSRSHLNDKQKDELSGLVFSDIPFLLDSNSAIFKEVKQAWSTPSFETLRLFSLGVDSYQLINKLVTLQNDNTKFYQGLIGKLSLDSTNTIKANLSWATYQQGKLIEITTPISAK